MTRDSFEELGLSTNPQKIVAYGGLNKANTLGESRVEDRTIRKIISVSNSKIEIKKNESNEELIGPNEIISLPRVAVGK